ncbi:hypothetical protein [Arthrobacter alpinus]|uniref:hypothetical protein n=1 Tax=Arthrobacter alpinus TaxID=656366 RepID=UPI001364D126|nr:hypothetical protein [Arthrobacter alpinus]
MSAWLGIVVLQSGPRSAAARAVGVRVDLIGVLGSLQRFLLLILGCGAMSSSLELTSV